MRYPLGDGRVVDASFGTAEARRRFVLDMTEGRQLTFSEWQTCARPCDDQACPEHGVAASNARQNEFYRRHAR